MRAVILLAVASLCCGEPWVKFRRTPLAHKKPISGFLDNAATTSVHACAQRCSQEGGCKALFFDPDNGECQTHATVYAANSAGLNDAPLTVYLENEVPQKTTTVPTTSSATTQTTTMSPQPTTTPSLDCLTDVDCAAFPNMDCRNAGVCTCVAGYSFEPSANTCVTNCSIGLGSSYTKTEGHAIWQIDFSELSNVNLEACLQACTAEPTCRSVDYWASNMYCYLSIVTKFDEESAWGSYPGYFDYYQRDCA